ncbi:Protein of unknown function DUF241 [Macleaya cordata]|uniref:DUF241 domain protein n=1 Tax=Macleaya cordata TaxID=56857 RepID=A0A200QNS6_MACCD|nr:Protein of unknown function DUF241 [Macleaya cordata]
MAASNKIAYHARSISLPTESHPISLAVEEQLCRLRSSEFASSSSICHNLAGLKDLYECVEDFIQLESTQTAKSVEGILDGSLLLLDICGTAKDVLSQMKQCVQDLQSSIRRRTNEFDAYMTSRKKVSKVIRKCLADLKKMNSKHNDHVGEISLLREVEATTLAIFESLLSFVSGPKQSSWSMVSKLMPTKRVAHKGEEETSEVMKVEIALKALISHKSIQVNNVQKPLEALEMSLQDLEDGLESVFRCLIKNRVSLLNILNQ